MFVGYEIIFSKLFCFEEKRNLSLEDVDIHE